MAHALTGDELTILRENDQASELYLAIQTPTNVWSAEVQLPAAGWDNNEVWGVPYGTVLYGAGNEDSLLLLYGMTMYVSSSGSAVGDYDVGMVRVRRHPLPTGTYVSQWGITGSYVPIGETSNIEWGDGMVITVVDEFQLWQKQKRLVDSSSNTVHWYDELPPADLYMDWDEVYAGQNDERDPIPIMGSHAVVWIPKVGGAVNVTFDASDSYTVGDPGATYTYGWQAPGNFASAESPDGSSITLSYGTTGVHRVTCTLVDDATARTWAGHRYIFIFDPNNLPITDFTLDECNGNWDEGGWSFKVTMYDEATLTDIRDRSLCVLFSRDYYGTKEQYVGPITDRENIIAIGWVDGESIQWNPWKGAVEFEVQGAHWWLNKITSWPTWAQDNQYELFDEEENKIEPFDWNLFSDMTIDKVLYQFLHWRSTITAVTDVFLTGDTRQLPDMNVSENNLWDQLSNITEDTIQAHPCCDRYGRLYTEIDPQVVLLDSRGAIPTVMSMTREDWRTRITIERRTIREVSILEFSGIWYSNGDWDNECYEGGGSAFSQHGGRTSLDRLLLYTTTVDNLEWCGLALNWMNNEYPVVSIPLSANNKAIDICPHQYITLTIAATDTERGIVWSSKKLVTRNVILSYNSGRMFTDLVCEYLVEDAAKSYEVTCPSEPDNDPEQPQEELPVEDEWPDISMPNPDFARSFSDLYNFASSYWGDEMGYEPDVVRNVSSIAGVTTEILNNYGYGLLTDGYNSLITQDWKSNTQHERYSLPVGPANSLYANLAFRMTLMESHKAATLYYLPGSILALGKVDFTTDLVTQLESYDFTYMTAQPTWMTWDYVNGDKVIFFMVQNQSAGGQPIHFEFYKYNWDKNTGSKIHDWEIGGTSRYYHYGDVILYNHKIYTFVSGSNNTTQIRGYMIDTQTDSVTHLTYDLGVAADWSYVYMLTPYISLNRIYMLTEHSNKWGGDLMKCYLDLSDNQLKGFEVVGTDSEYNYLGAWSDEKGYRIVDAGIADEGDVVDWATNDVVANIGNTNLDMDYPTRTIDNNENRLWRITANNQITGYLLDGSMTSRTITLSQSFGVPAASGKARRLYIGDGYFYALIYGLGGDPTSKVYTIT